MKCWNVENVLLWTSPMHVVPKFYSFCSISNRFWDKCKLTFSRSCDVKIENVSRSIYKKYINKIYLKKLKFLLLKGEIVENVYEPIRNQQIKIFKICYFACSNPQRVNNSIRFALSLTVSEISANLKILNFLKFLKF